MVQKLLRVFVIVVGVFIGPGAVYAVFEFGRVMAGVSATGVLEPWAIFLIYIGSAALSGIIFWSLSKKIVTAIMSHMHSIDAVASKTSPARITSGIIGLIVGLVIAGLLSVLIGSIPSSWVSVPLTVICFIITGSLGWSLGYTGRFDLTTLTNKGKKEDRRGSVPAVPKILDTSAIIDGRIYDICKTGVFDGEIIVPGFVVTELQHISDSSDSLKRQKGRRGLDILSKMQEDFSSQVYLTDRDFEDISEVDAKLIRLAVELKAKVVTLDYNLNKVARVYNVSVFNINDLSNAVKPVLLPGEELRVIIVKDGKEAKQGIAYLDDGTMIVVDGARGCAGEEKDIAVTSVLQTSAGRMIFAKVI